MLKVSDGRLYFQPSNVTTRRPASVTFHDPVPMPQPPEHSIPPTLFPKHTKQGPSDKQDVNDKHSPSDKRSPNDHSTQIRDGESKEKSACENIASDLAQNFKFEHSCEESLLVSSSPTSPIISDTLTTCRFGSVVTSGCGGAGKGSKQSLQAHAPFPASGVWPQATVLSSAHGTVSFAGPDNTVIMVNPSLPTLGDRIAGIKEQRVSGLGSDDPVSPLSEAAGSISFHCPNRTFQVISPLARGKRRKQILHTLSSPTQNMHLGNFAGFLPKANEPSNTSICEASYNTGTCETSYNTGTQETSLNTGALETGCNMGKCETGSETENSDSAGRLETLNKTQTSPSLLNTGSLVALLEQYGDEFTQSSLSLSFATSDNSNTCSDLLSKVCP